MNIEITRDGLIVPKEIEDLRETVGWDKSEGNYEQILVRNYTYYTVRNEEGLLCAYLSVLSDGVADAFLLDLIVRPQYQHKGIGTQLVHRAISDMKTAGVQCVHVTFADHLEPFYEHCGLHIFKAGIIDFKNMKWNEDDVKTARNKKK